MTHQKRIALFLLILILVGVAASLAARPMPASSATSPPPPAGFSMEKTTLLGSRYQLSSLSWQISGQLSGASYTLSAPSAPSLTGNGCCCNFMPCMLRKSKP
jgi:hypothetical protein